MNTIPRWLVAATVAVMLALVGGGAWFYRSQQGQFQRDAESQLEAVARLKVDQIAGWRAERLSDVNAVVRNPLFIELVRESVRGTGGADNAYRLARWLRTLQEQNQALRVLVLDASAKVCLSFPENATRFGPIGESAAMRAIQSKEVVMSDLHRSQFTGEIHLDLIVPVAASEPGREAGGEVVGAIDLEMDPQPFLYPLIQSWPTPSRSAETLLVRREGEEVVFLNELRHRKDTALSLRLPLSKDDLPAAMAVRGREGTVMGADYRGVPVLACVRAVPDSPWFLVAKVDAAEAFAGWRFRSLLILVLLIGITLSVIATGVAVWQRYAKAHYRALLHSEESKRRMEDRYRSLFDNMLNGFAYCRMIYENDQPRDFIYLSVNDAFGALTGLKDVVGKRVSEVIPGIREEDPELIARYGRVARSGVHEMFEIRVKSLGQWFSISVYQPEPDHFVAVFDVITERKQAELALRASEERFRLVSETAPDAIVSADSEGAIVYWNQAARKMFGYAAEEIIGRPLGVLMPEKLRAAHAEGMKRFLGGGGSRMIGQTVELEAVRKGGGEFPIQLSLANWQLDGRQYFTGFIRDITERKAHEREIERLNRLYNALSQINQAVVHARDRGAFMADVCKAAVKFGSFKAAWIAWRDPSTRAFVATASAGGSAELLGQMTASGEGGPAGAHPVEDCIREGRPCVFNDIEAAGPPVAWRDKAGQTGIRALAAFPIRSNGSFGGALVVHAAERDFFGDREVMLLTEAAMDISFGLDNLEHERQRREGEERYRLLADHAEDFVALHDAQGNRLYVSPSYYRVTGWTPEDIQRIHWRERLHPEDVPAVDKARTANLAGETTIIEHRVRCKDDSWLWVEARCKPIRGGDGQVERMVIWSRDITDRKLAWEEIRRLNETLEQRVKDRTAELEAANRELEAFSYSVSHDLRAPLRGINGFVGMLAEDYAKQLDDEGRRLLGVVSTETERMGLLIDDLLEFARLGRQTVRQEKIDMGAMAQRAFAECAAQAPGREIRFKLQPLPMAWGDPAMFPHVWDNLISNAVKYTRPRPVAEIEITGRADAAEVVYCVKDNGVGFDMEYARKLFGVFQRLHADTEFEGTGVGLALVQRIVHRHGGRVWAEAIVGEGAAFYFALPAVEEQ